MKRLVALVLVFSAVFVPAANALPLADFDVSVGMARPAPSGDFKYGSGSTITTMNLKDTLNMDTGSSTILRLDVKHAIPILPNIYIHHLPIKVEGAKDLASSVTFGTQTFSATTRVTSVLDMGQDDVGLYYSIPLVKSLTVNMLELKAGLNVRVMNFKASLASALPAKSEEKSFTAPIPMLYLGLDLNPIDLFSINAEVKTLSVGGNGITDYAAELRIKPLRILYIGVGYASETIKIDSNDINANISFAEPYVVVGAQF